MADNTLMKLLVEIGVDSSGVRSGLSGVDKQVKKSASGLGGLKDAFNDLGLGGVASMASVAGAAIALEKAISFSVQAAAESQQVNAQLDAVLRSTGGAAGMTADQIDKMATNMSRLSTFDDEAIKSSSALLLTFTNIGSSVFPQAEQAILDMSAKLGQDLKSSTIQLGKALNDPVKGITALQRVGVSFTESQKNVIEQMVKTGDTIGAQKLILEEISKEFGGSAAAAANTYAGQITQLKNEVGNLGEAFGNSLLPDLTQAVTDLKNLTIWVTDNAEAIKKFGNAIMWVSGPMGKLGQVTGEWLHNLIFGKDATSDAADATSNLGTSAGDTAPALDDMTAAEKAAADAAKALSDIYTGLLSSMFSINQQNERYAETVADLQKKDAELAAEKNQLTLQMWDEQAAGKLTNDEYLKYVQNLDEITQKQKENTAAIAKAGEEQKKAGEKRVYDLVQQRLAADGIIDSGEYEYLQNLAVQKGLVSKAAADQAIAESKAADALVAGFQRTQGPMDTALATMQDIASYNGMVVNFGVNFTQTGSMSNALAGMGGISNPAGYSAPTYTPINFQGMFHDRDSGGSGMAGTPYVIGTGAQPELFVPNSSGTFYPNAGKGMGATYNIVIYNPKKEAAEDSIRKSLKSLSYTGVG